MNKIINIGLTALFACFVAACENDIDNYDAPNGGVYGTIYDKETNEPVPMPVPGSSGVMMSLYEQNTGLPPLLISVPARMERLSIRRCSMAAIVFRQRMALLSGYVRGMSP